MENHTTALIDALLGQVGALWRVAQQNNSLAYPVPSLAEALTAIRQIEAIIQAHQSARSTLGRLLSPRYCGERARLEEDARAIIRAGQELRGR